jgi:hypothetical protein
VLVVAGAVHAEDVPASTPTTTTEGGQSVVRARRKKSAHETSVAADEARVVPGTQGDPVKVVQDLPGVARAAFGRGDVVVWGAAPRDTRVLVDGVEVPMLYHLGGFRSVIGAGLVDNITLAPGAFGVDVGRAIGGVVDVTTRALDPDGDASPHGEASVDPIDAAAQVTFSPHEHARVVVAGRASLLDLWWPAVVPDGVGDFVAVPHALDAQAKATFALRAREELTVGVLAARDALSRTIASVDPTSMRGDERKQAFARLFVRYARRGGGHSVHATAWLGVDERSSTTTNGASSASLTVSSPLAGARAFLRQRVLPALAVQTGVDALLTNSDLTRSGSLLLPPREGDPTIFGAVVAADVNADAWTTTQLNVAPYVAADITLGPATISPGLRLDGWALSASRLTPRAGTTPSIGTTTTTFSPDPRIAATYRTTSWLTLRAAGGIYHQPPPVDDTSAVFGNPRVGLERATHVAGGGVVRVVEDAAGALDVDVTGFYRYAEGLLARVPSSQPPLAGALANDGVGVATGATVQVRRSQAGGAFGWLAYTLSRSERQDDVTARYRLADFDQTHVVTAVAGAPLGPFVVSARARAATGMPRTPVVGAVFDARRDAYEPVLGARNTTRLPPFFQLDARAETTLRAPPFVVDVALELQNVTLHDNAEEIVFSSDYSAHALVTGVPFLAVLGARVRF